MTNNPLIDPPSWPLVEFRVPREFVKHWESRYKEVGHKPDAVLQLVAEQASQWGADKELDACCEWLERNYNYTRSNHPLRTARRPKPPNLKKQAMEAIYDIECRTENLPYMGKSIKTIRTALEVLPNDN